MGQILGCQAPARLQQQQVQALPISQEEAAVSFVPGGDVHLAALSGGVQDGGGLGRRLAQCVQHYRAMLVVQNVIRHGDRGISPAIGRTGA